MGDKEMNCKECGNKFTITVKDREWYAEKGFKEPRRCKACRKLRREQAQGKEN